MTHIAHLLQMLGGDRSLAEHGLHNLGQYDEFERFFKSFMDLAEAGGNVEAATTSLWSDVVKAKAKKGLPANMAIHTNVVIPRDKDWLKGSELTLSSPAYAHRSPGKSPGPSAQPQRLSLRRKKASGSEV
jgi:hypothetical protein